jgi:CheY-like chemotaxis protein
VTDSFEILVADDNPVALRPLVSVMEAKNMVVTVVTNGREAVDAVKTHEFDLVLMDCNMPVMDGFLATEEIREWESKQGKPRMPIIALTNMDDFGAEKMTKDAGMDAHIAKPITVKAINAIIEQLKKT